MTAEQPKRKTRETASAGGGSATPSRAAGAVPEPAGKTTSKRPGKRPALPSSWRDLPVLADPRPSTLAQYRKKSDAILRLASDGLKLDRDQITWPMAADWLIENAGRYKPGSFDIYRAALLWRMGAEGCTKKQIAPLKATGNGRCRTTTRGGPAVKAKGVKPEDLDRLLKYLLDLNDNHRAQTGFGGVKMCMIARSWLIAGLATGLRPTEWRDARIAEIDGTDTLIVQNAKVLFTASGEQWRGNGIERTLALKGMSREDDLAIRITLKALGSAQEMGRFDWLHCRCGEVLWRANRALWPKRLTHVTLYTARHQHTADLKESGRAPEEIAAALGHRTTATASRHYGKKSKGTVRVLPEPNPESVKTVKIVKGRSSGADETGGKYAR